MIQADQKIRYSIPKTVNIKKINPQSLAFRGNNQYLIAVDLDGTLCHGTQEDFNRFLQVAKQKNYKLMFATGRKFKDYEEIKMEFLSKGIELPLPDYYAARNGQFIYEKVNNQMVLREDWNYLMKQTGFNREKLKAAMNDLIKENTTGPVPPLLQFDYLPSQYNLEFLVNDKFDGPHLENKIQSYLKERNIHAKLIFDRVPPDSTRKSLEKLPPQIRQVVEQMLDKEGGINTINICPADKADSVEFVRNLLGVDKAHVVTAGNAGNDISMTDKGYWFILVHNAEKMLKDYIEKLGPEIKEKVLKVTRDGTAGIVEGLEHIYSVIGFR